MRKFSIITPSYNRDAMIETAIQSVLDQNYQQVEHIIVDGGSTDGTLTVLAKYPHLRVVSEADKGMYDALNKGLMLAKGDVIGLLNSDDLYAFGAFSAVADAFASGPVDYVIGQAGTFLDNSETISYLFDTEILDQLMEKSILGDTPINAFFFRKKVFDIIGNFDSSYKIVADREFILRLALTSLVGREISRVLYYYREHPGSLTFAITDQKTRSLVNEQLLWTEKFIRKKEVSNETKMHLFELRTQGTIRVCGHCVRERDLAGALFYMREGLRYNPFWFYRFFKHALLHPMRQKLGLPYRTP